MTRPPVSRRNRLAWGMVVSTSLLAVLCLVVLAPSHAPVRRGSVNDFWEAALHFTPSDSLGGLDDAYYVDGKWCAYEYSHMHGSIVYSVPTSEVEASFSEIVQRLHQASLAGDESRAVQVYESWRADGERQQNLRTLIQHVIEVDRQPWKDDIDMLCYVVDKERLFWQRWNRRQHFWASICFEWMLFTALALCVFWPFVGGGSFFRRVACVGAAPPLLILPIYLGYATYTFTSHGPAGGILYPYAVLFLPRFNNTVDRWLLHYTPPLLESISTPIGEPMALTGMGVPSLTMALTAGATLVACLCTMQARWQRPLSLKPQSD